MKCPWFYNRYVAYTQFAKTINNIFRSMWSSVADYSSLYSCRAIRCSHLNFNPGLGKKISYDFTRVVPYLASSVKFVGRNSFRHKNHNTMFNQLRKQLMASIYRRLNT